MTGLFYIIYVCRLVLAERSLLVEDGVDVGSGPERMRKADWPCCDFGRGAIYLLFSACHLVRQQYKLRIRRLLCRFRVASAGHRYPLYRIYAWRYTWSDI